MHYLTEYQTFNDKQELNYHVKQHIDVNYEDTNATDRQVFKFIARYAVKYAGASHLKVNTIADYIERTPRTVRNVLAKLERLGMIRRITKNRKKTGGQGANIIVILPFNSERTSCQTSEPISVRTEDEKPTETEEEASNSEKEPLRKHAFFNNNVLATRIGEITGTEDTKGNFTETSSKQARALRQSIPEVIYDALSPFFNADELYKTYGILLRAKSKTGERITLEEFGKDYVDVFMNVVRHSKLGNVKFNFDGLLYAAWSRLSSEISRRIKEKRTGKMAIFERFICGGELSSEG